jgi:hypothetical protein
MWVALAIMTTESIVSLLPVVLELVRALRAWPETSETSPGYDLDEEKEPPERLVRTRYTLWGLFVSALLGTLIIRVVFGDDGIKAWATLIGFVLAALLSLLGCVVCFPNFITIPPNELQSTCTRRDRLKPSLRARKNQPTAFRCASTRECNSKHRGRRRRGGWRPTVRAFNQKIGDTAHFFRYTVGLAT